MKRRLAPGKEISEEQVIIWAQEYVQHHDASNRARRFDLLKYQFAKTLLELHKRAST